MYTAEMVDGQPVVIKNGEIVEANFFFLSEAQERADELNEELTES